MDLLSMIIESRGRTSLAYRAAVLQDNPVAYWRLGESSGTTAVDEIGSYNGTYVGNPTLGVGGIFAGNTAVTLNGTTQNVNCGIMADFLTGRTVGLAVEAWIRRSGGGFITGKWASSGTGNQRIYFNCSGTGGLSFGIFGGSGGYRVGSTAIGVVPSGVWTHVVGVWVSTTSMAIYVNGVSQSLSYGSGLAGTTTSTLAASTNNFRIGSESTSNFFNGSVDEVAVYSSLSPERILAHYNAGAELIKPFDSDALDYFNRVEAAGSTINADNKNAINQFIVGCKEDGNWSSIKASCILAGADTLSGALVPLVGPAPTNFNFVEADYSRTTGLIGNGSTKYLNSNRANDADPLGSKHLACWATNIGNTSSTRAFLDTKNEGGRSALLARTTIDFFAYANEGSALPPALSLAGFIGVSRTSSTNLNVRYNGINTSKISNQNNSATSIGVFASGTGEFINNARISFYSIGESINLALLDTRLAKLMRSLRPTYDVTALDYFARVEAVGSTINGNNKDAINSFIVGCKADGIWDSIKASCILAGADTLSGALVPLVGPDPTLFNFTEDDYSRTTGLRGGFPRRFDTGRADDADPQNNCHAAVWVTDTGGGTTLGIVGSVSETGNPQRRIHRSNTTCNDTTAANYTITTGLLGITRSLPDRYIRRNNNTNVTVNNTSTGTSADNVALFARNTAGSSSWGGRLSFYSLGESIDLALLNARLATLMSSLI